MTPPKKKKRARERGGVGPHRGKLSKEEYEQYKHILDIQAIRGDTWEAVIPPTQASSVRLQVAIPRFKPVPRDARDVHALAEYLYQVFAFGYMSTLLSDAQWKNPVTQRYLPYLRLEVPCLVRSLSIQCEKHSVPSAPLAELASKWGGLLREHPDPRKALLHFEDGFAVAELQNALAETVQRLLRITEEDVVLSMPKAHGKGRQRQRKEARRAPRRIRAKAPRGWIYLNDAIEKYGVARATLHGWVSSLDSDSKVKDEDSGQVRVRESVVRGILKSKGRLGN